MNDPTFLQEMNRALLDALDDPRVVICGQLVKYGLGGLTTGCFAKAPAQVLTYPVAENLMHASAMGLALAGYKPIVINERMDFTALAMDVLLNHAPIWPKRDPSIELPMVVVAVVGKGKGQGPQHSKNWTHWFRQFEGWTVCEPQDPEQAYGGLLYALDAKSPVLYVAHREFFGRTDSVSLPLPDRIGLCGASAEHERAFYANVLSENK